MSRSLPAGLYQATIVGGLGAVITAAWSWRPSYWFDEAATLSAVDRTPGQLWDMLGHVGAVNALYYAVVQRWVEIFGGSELATRSFSAIGTGVTCGTVALLGRWLRGPLLGWSAGFVAAVLPGLSWAGAETRVYAWNSAFAVIATLMLMRAERSGRTRDWVWYAAAMTVMGYLFLFSLLLLPVHLVTLLMQRRVPRAWWFAAGATAVAVIPFLVVAWPQRERVAYAAMGPLELVGKAGLRQVFLSTRADDSFGIALVCAVLLLAVSVALVVAVVAAARHDGATWSVVSVGLPWALLPTVVLVLYSMTGRTIYQERYLTFCAPGMALLLGAGLLELRTRRSWFVAACLAFVVLPLPILVQQKGVNSRSHQDYRRLAAFVAAHSDAVLFTRDDARSLRAAYPGDFEHVQELNLQATAAGSDSLWGEVSPVRQLPPGRLAGRRVSLVTMTGARPRADDSAQWLGQHGCRQVATAAASRLTVLAFQC